MDRLVDAQRRHDGRGASVGGQPPARRDRAGALPLCQGQGTVASLSTATDFQSVPQRSKPFSIAQKKGDAIVFASDEFINNKISAEVLAGRRPAFDNAGITRDTTFKKMDKVNWDAVMRTNLDSLFNMTKQVADGMVERNWGRIIHVSSVNGSKGAFGQTNYSAAKAGVHGFTKALALEVAKKNVTVNTISPGYIGTKMVTAIPKEVLDSKILPHIPVGRLGKPEEVAGPIIYLASEEAAFVTGANVAINGGQHMQ